MPRVSKIKKPLEKPTPFKKLSRNEKNHLHRYFGNYLKTYIKPHTEEDSDFDNKLDREIENCIKQYLSEISPNKQKKIFDRFYQKVQHLYRENSPRMV